MGIRGEVCRTSRMGPGGRSFHPREPGSCLRLITGIPHQGKARFNGHVEVFNTPLVR